MLLAVTLRRMWPIASPVLANQYWVALRHIPVAVISGVVLGTKPDAPHWFVAIFDAAGHVPMVLGLAADLPFTEQAGKWN